MKTPNETGGSSGPALEPRARAPGGVWLTQSDFPHAFQNVIVYHNPTKYSHTEVHQDIWENREEPYISNQSEVYIKLELDPEAVQRVQQQEAFYNKIGIQGAVPEDASVERLAEGEEGKGEEEGEATKRPQGDPLPGERKRPAVEHDDFLVACAPYPSNKALEVLPRYLTRIKQVDCESEISEGQLVNQNYKSYFGGVQFRMRGELAG